MRAIYKFELQTVGRQEINLPMGAVIISAQAQSGNICLWVELDTKAQTYKKAIHIYGTGHEIDDDLHLRFIDTVQLANGALVFHIYYAL